MSLPDDYLDYPLRRYGMDHERYDWSVLGQRPPVRWGDGKRLALWVVPALEWFPLDMQGKPFKPPGALQTAYPDLRHYTLRDYGNRVGIFRIMEALDQRGLPASVAVNAALAQRTPSLLQACVQRGWEIIANGVDMDHLHHGGLDQDQERAWIVQAITVLQQLSGQRIRGWLSPAKSQSHHTLDLLAEAGLDYCCDWVNDDLPYAMRTRAGTLFAMPHSIDIDDHTILVQNHHSEDDFRDQLIDQFDALYREASPDNGRVMSIALHPWVIGQPYRIGALEQALDHIVQHSGVWAASGSAILDAWRAGSAQV